MTADSSYIISEEETRRLLEQAQQGDFRAREQLEFLAFVLWLLGADNSTLFMAMFAFASALGLNTVVVPAAYDSDTTTGAGMAMTAHVGAIVTIPLLSLLL